MNAAETAFYLWLVESIGGLVLIGFGLSLFGHAVIKKAGGADFKTWFLWGTLSLVVVNAGVCIFADGVQQRMIYEAARTGQRQ